MLRHMVPFYNFVEFIAKTEEFVVFMKVYNKNIITLVTCSDGWDHVSWLGQELDFVLCDPIVPGAATRWDPTHQIKLLKQ